MPQGGLAPEEKSLKVTFTINTRPYLGPGPNLRKAFEWRAWVRKWEDGPCGLGFSRAEAIDNLKAMLKEGGY